MRKEVRANVIFFVVLAVLILPGFVILMRKKLAGPTDPNYLPPMIPHEAAYIQPEPVPPTAPRVEPAEVRSWVTRQLHDRVDPNASVARDATGAGAAVGDRYVTQLVHRTDDKLVLLIWSAAAERVSVSVAAGDTERTITDGPPAWVDVPKTVRHALQKVGYLLPPERVAWVEATLDEAIAPGAMLRVAYDGKNEAIRLP